MRTLKIRTLLIAAIVSFCCALMCMAFAPIGVKAEGSYFEMEQAAFFRVGSANGIRFRAKFSDDVKGNIENADEYGFLVFPQQLLKGENNAVITDNYITSVSKYIQIVSNKDSYVENGSNYLNCAIKNILEDNYSLGFTAVCYYKTGETYTYANLNPDFSRSLTQLLSKGYLNINGADKTENRADIAETYNWFPSEDNPVEISSAAELASVSAEVKGGNTFENVNFKLTDDITLGNDYEAIAESFAGYIDANEKTVSSKYGIELAETSGTVTNLGARKSVPESTNAATSQWMTQNNVSQYGVKTIGANNTFVMYKSDMYISGSCTVKHGNPYIALNGNYGAGTFISLDFVGKAMPYVSFFNKNVTASMIDGEEGILLVNGVTGLNNNSEQTSSIADRFSVFAPNKASSGNYWSGTDRITLESNSSFGAQNLVDGTNYRLVLGITNCATGTGASAKFTVNAILVNADTNQKLQTIRQNCTLKFTYQDNEENVLTTEKTFGENYFNGSIVIYGSSFGETTVKINSVTGLENLDQQNLTVSNNVQEWINNNNIKYYNAESISSVDGTITLAQNQYLFDTRAYLSDVPYLSINKEINFENTVVSIDFTGKNMPIIGFAQGAITSSWINGTKGIILSNGFGDYTDTEYNSGKYENSLTIVGPNNIPTNGNFYNEGNIKRLFGNDSQYFGGVQDLVDGQGYRLVAGIVKLSDGYYFVARLYTKEADGSGLDRQVNMTQIKIEFSGANNADYFKGYLTFFSGTRAKAVFKINSIYTGVTTSDIYSIASNNVTNENLVNTFFQLAA